MQFPVLHLPQEQTIVQDLLLCEHMFSEHVLQRRSFLLICDFDSGLKKKSDIGQSDVV